MRVWLGWLMIAVVLVGWPATLIFTDEPRFVLSLSWFALLLEAWNMVQIAEKRDGL